MQLNDTDEKLKKILVEFEAEHSAMSIKRFSYSYVENLKNISSLEQIEKQTKFFRNYNRRLQQLDNKKLSRESNLKFDSLKFEIDLELDRLSLEKDFKRSSSSVPEDGLFKVRNHSQWYQLYLKRWSSSVWKADEVFDHGEKEVERILVEYRKLQKKLGYGGKDQEFSSHLNGSDFLITDEAKLLSLIQTVQLRAINNLGNIFEIVKISPPEIKPMANATKDSPPGSYHGDEKVFYYNFYNQSFPSRSLEWLYMHEAIPGHHYQQVLADGVVNPIVSKRFWYPGYEEGWAAYIENLSTELGMMTDVYQKLGKWEWDLVRSVRLAIDVGLNLKGWTKENALAYWKRHVPNQDHIAQREIDRMIRWPGQVVSYKVGEKTILNLRDFCVSSKKVSLKTFHRMILEHGPLPLPVLEEAVRQSCLNAADAR